MPLSYPFRSLGIFTFNELSLLVIIVHLIADDEESLCEGHILHLTEQGVALHGRDLGVQVLTGHTTLYHLYSFVFLRGVYSAGLTLLKGKR